MIYLIQAPEFTYAYLCQTHIPPIRQVRRDKNIYIQSFNKPILPLRLGENKQDYMKS
jgi:hypothetical protein